MTRAVCSACVPEPTSRLTSGAGNSSSREERARHRLVVVLPGVDENLRDLVRAPSDGGRDRRHLHEVRPRPHHVENPHHSLSLDRGSAVLGLGSEFGVRRWPGTRDMSILGAAAAMRDGRPSRLCREDKGREAARTEELGSKKRPCVRGEATNPMCGMGERRHVDWARGWDWGRSSCCSCPPIPSSPTSDACPSSRDIR